MRNGCASIAANLKYQTESLMKHAPLIVLLLIVGCNAPNSTPASEAESRRIPAAFLAQWYSDAEATKSYPMNWAVDAARLAELIDDNAVQFRHALEIQHNTLRAKLGKDDLEELDWFDCDLRVESVTPRDIRVLASFPDEAGEYGLHFVLVDDDLMAEERNKDGITWWLVYRRTSP